MMRHIGALLVLTALACDDGRPPSATDGSAQATEIGLDPELMAICGDGTGPQPCGPPADVARLSAVRQGRTVLLAGDADAVRGTCAAYQAHARASLAHLRQVGAPTDAEALLQTLDNMAAEADALGRNVLAVSIMHPDPRARAAGSDCVMSTQHILQDYLGDATVLQHLQHLRAHGADPEARHQAGQLDPSALKHGRTMTPAAMAQAKHLMGILTRLRQTHEQQEIGDVGEDVETTGDLAWQAMQARHALAQLQGATNWAALQLSTSSLGGPSQVVAMLERLEHDMAQGPVPAVDADAQSQDALDQAQARTFLLAHAHVIPGILRRLGHLFGVQFEPVDAPDWAPGVQSLRVRRQGMSLGTIHLDLVARPGKRPGAYCIALAQGKKNFQAPVGIMGMSLEAGRTAQMGQVDVLTFMHEFGHLMATILPPAKTWFADRVEQAAEDTEITSKLLEHLADDYGTASTFAFDASGRVMPPELFDRLTAAARRNRWAQLANLIPVAQALIQVHALADAAYAAPVSPFQQDAHIPRVAFLNAQALGYDVGLFTYVWADVAVADLLGALTPASLGRQERDRRLAAAFVDIAASDAPSRALAERLQRPISTQALLQSLRAAH